ncbi:uncharacterized protein LOC116935589 [Daphnia magna]|uniref:uncharacterized protein LOC116935589 n=1 Tax=Daphnia magna TaxID=35525 RepID=UPI001E1BB1BD|nr:uncharacterized protein LOC116935589 [Daphnia magna]
MASSSESDGGAVDPKVTLALRTKAKRAHTRRANKLSSLIEQSAPNEEVAVALAVLEEAYIEATTLNGKYKQTENLSEEQQLAATQWESEVSELFNGCRNAAQGYLRKEKRDKPTDSDDGPVNAKKRRIELEHQRQQVAIEEQRKLEDVRQRSKREQEDLTLQIEFHRQLEGLTSTFAPGLSSTMLNVAPEEEKIPTGCWPKITIKPFNGDPRTWPEFSLSFKAVVHDSRMPDLMKMIALRDNLDPEVRRRVSNLFSTSAVYNETWETLNNRFGNVQVIIHAHIQELLALQPFKSGDLRALINMAALVKDAVTSVDQQGATSYSNIVSQLVRVLPNELQREWGRFAYPLRPKIPGLADFDRWIEGIVGAEEFMGGSTSSKIPHPPSNRQVKFGPTVMATVLKSPPAKSNACGVCKSDPGHPLAFCQVFIDLSPTQRAEAVAKTDNCFRCLGRNHYSASCKKSTKCTVTDCDQWHHPLLHGSGRVFPRRQESAKE